MSSPTAPARGTALLAGLVSLAVGIAAWWTAASLPVVPDYVLPSPGELVSRAVTLFRGGGLGVHLAQTLAEVLQGVLIGTVAGVLLAVLFVRLRWLEKLLMPVIVVVQVTPKISIAPLIVLWLGLGIGSKITLIALVTFYPILVNVVAKLRGMPTAFDDLSVVLGMSGARRARVLQLPFALPALLAGLRVGVLQAVTAAVIGEFIGAQAGLGYLEKQAQDNDDIQVVFITLILLCLIGWVLYAVVDLVERQVKARFDIG
ncbi:ABC transporter permease [Actinosynnema sp.]|uniref:ABC transporter permease n=1 Tax=Actinosynnema sp. TaxID=1872144 RepID=UPI003F84FB1A